MSTYGKLTKARSKLSEIQYYTTNSGNTDLSYLNDQYDYHIQRLVNLLPTDERSYIESDGTLIRIWDNITLTEDDVIASQCEVGKDMLMAATAMIRRWLARLDYEESTGLGFELEEDEDGQLWGGIFFEDIGSPLAKEIYVPPQQNWNNNPKYLADIIADSIKDLETIWDMAGGYMDLDWLKSRGAIYEPYPMEVLQNIYNNAYFKSEREYSVPVVSRLVDTVPNILESNFFQQAAKAPTNTNRVVDQTALNNFVFGLQVNSASNSLANMNLMKISGAVRSNYFTSPLSSLASPSSFARKPISYSGTGNGSNVMPLSGGGNYNQLNKVSGVKTSGAGALFQNISNIQQVKVEGSPVKAVLIRRNIPLVDKTAGNEVTKFRGEQLTANVATLISEDGQQRILNEPNDQISQAMYNGKVKLYKTAHKVIEKQERRIAKYSVSPLGTQTTTIFNSITNLNGYLTIGSLGVEQFEGLGYNNWCLGVGATMFLMDIEKDVGYNSWDAGKAYDNGRIEAFSDGWTAGFSPYSRKGESASFSEDLTSTISGGNIFKTSYPYLQGTLRVYLNGMEQIKGITFVEQSSQSFTMSETPVASDTLSVTYTRFYGTQDPGSFKKSATEQFKNSQRKQGSARVIDRSSDY